MKGYAILMIGVPGSGKSTIARHLLETSTNTIIVSRDEIRFSLLKDGDSYFSKEDEVKKIFLQTIKENLQAGKTVIIDATHLTPQARRKIITPIKAFCKGIIAYWVDESLETCLERNSHRTGRSRVPDHTIENMYRSFIEPSRIEGFTNIIKTRRTGNE